MRASTRFIKALVVLSVSAVVVGVLHPAQGFLLLPLFGMATEATTTAIIDEALKVIFSTGLHNDIVNDSELMGIFQTEMDIKTEDTTGGRYVEQGHFWTLPAGAGWRKDNEYIPEAVSATFKNSRIYLKKFQLTLEMSGDTMRRVRTDEGAFLDYMERARPALVERANQELDLAYIGFGSGIKARVNSAITDNADGTMTFAVDSHSGVAGYTDAWLTFLEGERVVFSDTAGFVALRAAGANQSGKITDLDEDLATVTVEAHADLIAAAVENDYICTGDAAGHSGSDASADDRALAGILAGADDGNIVSTYNNIDRSAAGNRLWKTIIVDGGATPFDGTLTEKLLNTAFRRSHIRGQGKADCLVMSWSARDSYWESLKGDRFFIDPGGNYKAGRGRLEIVSGDTTYPLKVARKLPPEVCFGLQSNRWYRLTLGQLTWEEETGSMWNRVTDSTGRKDTYYAAAHMYEQLFCAAPRKQWRIDNLTPIV